MSNNSSALVNKLWNYCNVLRDDGLSYGDYVEQLTFLLFLKMAHERTQPPYNQPSIIPEEYNWPSLLELDGIPLEYHLPSHSRNPRQRTGHAPDHLSKGPEQNPGRSQAQTPHR